LDKNDKGESAARFEATIPRMRMPALLKGQVISFNLESLEGQWGIVCHLPQIEFCEAILLNQYHRTVKQTGATLLGMLPFLDPWFESRLPKAKVLGVPLLADPLGRLHRVLGLSKTASSNRCRSFIFDPKGVIRYHLVHLLNWHGMNFLMEILKHCQDRSPQPTSQLMDHHSVSIPGISEQSQVTRTLPSMIPTLSLHPIGGTRYATE
jgi:hypothetical protein